MNILYICHRIPYPPDKGEKIRAVYVQQVSQIPKVMDFVDADSAKWRLFADHHPWVLSWIYRLEARRLAQYEIEIARTFDHAIFVTDREARLLRQHVSERPISVI